MKPDCPPRKRGSVVTISTKTRTPPRSKVDISFPGSAWERKTNYYSSIPTQRTKSAIRGLPPWRQLSGGVCMVPMGQIRLTPA